MLQVELHRETCAAAAADHHRADLSNCLERLDLLQRRAPEAGVNPPTFGPACLGSQSFPPVSFELARDGDGIQDQLGQFIQDAKDDLEATKFRCGTGTGEPQGLITGAPRR